MFKLLTSKTKLKSSESLRRLQFYFSSSSGQASVVPQQNKVTERLSFLKSEEEMRKYFNLIDWDKKACEEEIEKEFLKEKEKFSKIKKEYQNFNRQDLFEIAKKFKEKLNLTSSKPGKDYLIPEEVLNYKKQHLKGFELINEFSMENADILKDKPKNYLLVSGFETGKDVEEVLSLFKESGEIVKTNVLPDLMGRDSMIEVYFYTDEEARKAKLKFHNFIYKSGYALKVANYMDVNSEGLPERTVVISGLDKSVKQQQLLELLSVNGNVVKLEMPMTSANKPNDTNLSNSRSPVDIFNTCEKYFKELENNINLAETNEKILAKNKMNFYLEQLHKLIKDFKNKVMINKSEEDSGDYNYNSRFNNLLVEIKFFMKKFFPNEAINSLIIPELETIQRPNQTWSENTLKDRKSEIEDKAYNNIINNIESFLKKYEDKMNNLAKPLSKEEIPIDLFEGEELTSKANKAIDPEKLDRNLIYESADATETSDPELLNQFSKMNFYSSFQPLEDQIAKLNFIRSLSGEEKEVLKLKYDVKLSVNTPKFLEYFINFSRAAGVKALDKYIELSELYMSMSPLERVYHGKMLLKKMQGQDSEDKRKGGFRKDKVLLHSLHTFLGLRTQRKLKTVYAIKNLERKFNKSPSIKYLNYERDIVLTDLYNMIDKGVLPNLTMQEYFSFFRTKNRYVRDKTRYLQALVPVNIAKKRLFIERIRARMIKYNEILREFLSNYELLPSDHPLRKKYDTEVNKLAALIFGKYHPLSNVDMSVLEDEGEEKIGFNTVDSSGKLLENASQKKETANSSGKNKKQKKTSFSRTEYKYSGKPLEENQIINRLDYIKSARDKIINSVLRIRNNTFYKSKRFDRIGDMVQRNLQEKVNTLFQDDPKIHAYYLEKINSIQNKFKYVNTERMNFEEKQYKLEELVEDIIQKEVDYSQRISRAKYYFENLEELLEEKISKNNLVQAFGVYDVFYSMNEKYGDIKYLKNHGNRLIEGSPIFNFFMHVKQIFKDELDKVKVIKDIKFEEMKKDHHLSLDEMFNKRKELIEDYANKIGNYKKAEEIQSSTLEELEEYKLKKLGAGVSGEILNDFLDEDDRQGQTGIYNNINYLTELKKKEFEIKQNKVKFGAENEEEYSDVTALLSNLNKIKKSNQGVDSSKSLSGFEKIFNSLNSKKVTNKGYAFVTFANSDQAKRIYLTALAGLKIGKKNVKVEPKFDYNHEHFNEEFFYKRAKLDGNLINKREELLEAEKKLKDFESSFWNNLDENEKLNEFSKARDAFKDQYSDPFKKHDTNNPFTQEDEEEIKYRNKVSGVSEENAWLFEDDKIEKLRRSRDKRIVNKYTEAQLIKRGIIDNEFVDNSNRNGSSAMQSEESARDKFIQPLSNTFFNKSNEFEPMQSKSLPSPNGRRFNPMGTLEFLEKTFGRDGLSISSPAFEKDRREKAVYSEVKELRERFPKEKFVEDPQITENLIEEVNSRFIKLLKEEDMSDSKKYENTKEEIWDKMTNISPVGKKLQLIINERNEQLEDEETRQIITMQNFYNRKINKHQMKGKLISHIPETEIGSVASYHLAFHHNQDKILRYVRGTYDPPLNQPKKEVEKVTYDPSDTSFKAFLARRKMFFEERKGEVAKDEKNKTQFDPNNININQVHKVKQDVMNDLYSSIKQKYNLYIKNKANLDVNSQDVSVYNRNTIYEHLKTNNARKGSDSKRTNQLSKEIEAKLRKEKLKQKYFEELEKNFANELDTLPAFREHFLNLKNGVDSKSNEEESFSFLHNFSSSINFDKRREEIALLYSDKITPSTFEKTFEKNQKEREKKFKEWLTEEDMELIKKLEFSKMGIDLNDAATMERLKSDNPHLFDEEAAKEYIEQMKATEEMLEEVENSEDKDEVEYFFNPEGEETLEEHLAAIAQTRYTNVSLRKDEEGRLLIKKQFKHNYKYDLDEVMSFDLAKERAKLMKKIENLDFNAEINGSVEYYLKFYQMLSYNSDYVHQYLNTSDEDFEKVIKQITEKVEDFFQHHYGISNFTFDDFKRLVDNLLSMSPQSVTTFANTVTRLIDAVQKGGSLEVSETLKELSEFSRDVFNEREVRIFVELMKPLVLNEAISNFGLKTFDNMSKFVFIEQILLAESLGNIKNFLSGHEIIYLYGILKLLPNDFPTLTVDESQLREKLTATIWNNYKQHMLKEFNIVLKRENEIKPGLGLTAAKEQRNVFKKVLNEMRSGTSSEKSTLSNINAEIKQYSDKLKEYYTELAQANTSDYDISTLVSDEELFIEEISEQIAKRIERLKTGREISKQDLVKRRYNEENLYKKQLEYVHRLGKSYEALAFREDVEDNKEMQEEVKEVLRQNALRKRKLLKEGKPEIDLEFNRMI